jgi:hypothetical protein
MVNAAWASRNVTGALRPAAIAWVNAANSSRQELSSPGYSQIVVSGGPMAGFIL